MANPTQIKNALLKALNNNEVPPSVLVNWFEKSMEPAAKEALTAEDVQDVNSNLVSEADYSKLENEVKNSLLKQKAKLQSEFNNLLTQVNLKDPEEAQKMFPADIRKQFTPELEKEWEKVSKEQEKASVKEAEINNIKTKIILGFLLLCGVTKDDEDDKYIRDNLQNLLASCGFNQVQIKDIANTLKGYVGVIGADKIRTRNSGYVRFIESMMNGEKNEKDINQKWTEFQRPVAELQGTNEVIKDLVNKIKEVTPNNFLKMLKEFKKYTNQDNNSGKDQQKQDTKQETQQQSESVNGSVEEKTIREVLEEAEDEEASIDFVTNYTDDFEMATWEFGTKLTEEGEEDWEDVLDYVVENLDKDEDLNWFAQVKIPEGEEMEMNRAERRLYKFLQSAAGNCSDEDYDRWFEV